MPLRAFSLLLFAGFGACYDKVPPPSDPTSSERPPLSIEEQLRALPPRFLDRIGRLARVNMSETKDVVDEIIAKAQNLPPYTTPKTSNDTDIDLESTWNYPPAMESFRKIFGTSNWSQSDLCKKLIGGFRGDIIIVPALRANEVSYIGGSIAAFIGSKIGIMVIMGSLVMNGALSIWLLGSTACCFMHRRKKNSLKRTVRESAPSSRFSTMRRHRRVATCSDKSSNDQANCGDWFTTMFRCSTDRTESEAETIEMPNRAIMDSSDEQRVDVDVRDDSSAPAAPPRNSPPGATDHYSNISICQAMSSPLPAPPSPPSNPFDRAAVKRK